MKRGIFLSIAAVMFTNLQLMAQKEQPVKWSYSAIKIDDRTFEIHIHAAIDEGWHVYSQVQPEGAIGQPVQFRFNANPLVQLKGVVQEKGKLDKHRDEILGITQNQYLKEVDFVQQVQLKAPAKTNISGMLTFQACTDERCLFPQEMPFTVVL